jgi:hypothetical protein
MKTSRLVSSLSLIGLASACAADDGASSQLVQAVCPPTDLAEYAVCICEDLTQVGYLKVSAGPGGPGSVGVNGRTDLIAYAEVEGSWFAWGGFSGIGASVGDSLFSPKDVRSIGDLEISGDLQVGGNLEALGRLKVGGTLGVAGTSQVLGLETAKRGSYLAPAGAPCGCEEAKIFDVAAAVTAAATSAGGLTSWQFVGHQEVHLETGSYYLKDVKTIGNSKIYIDGKVSLFVDGSLTSIGREKWVIAPGARLDLFVSGDVTGIGVLIAGSKAAPEDFQLYVGGREASLEAIGASAFYGSIYAPQATLKYIGATRIVGSVFAKQLSGIGKLTIEYGRAVTPPTACDQPPAPPSDSDPVD